MSWDEGINLGVRFEHACQLGRALHPHWSLGRSYGGFARALSGTSDRVAKACVRRLQQQMQGCAGPYWTRCGKRAFAVDGSRREAPHTAANEAGLGCAGREKTAPQVFHTTMYHMGLGLPWDFRVGPGTDSERRHLEDMLAGLPEHSLIVADAGFVGYETCQRILAADHDFLLRVGSNVTLLKDLGYDVQLEGPDRVWLWPQDQQRRGAPLVLRLIQVTHGEQTIYLVTNVLDEQELSQEEAALLYEMRWGVEVFYRSYKQTLDRHTLLSRTPKTCLAEAQWTMLGVWLLGLLAVTRQLEEGHDPLGLSMAKARDTVRLAMRRATAHQPHGKALGYGLIHARLDRYVRRGSKTARNYPRKKQQTPPGSPKIKTATPEEVARAARLRKKLHPVA